MSRWGAGLVVGLIAVAVVPTGTGRHLLAASVVAGTIAAITWSTIRLPRRDRWWTCAAVGVCLAATAHLAERAAGVYPESVARLYELGYALGYVLCIAGFHGLTRGRLAGRSSTMSVTAEATAFGAAFAMLAWLLVIEPTDPDGSADAIVAAAFPLADVVLLVVLLRLVLADPTVKAGWFLSAGTIAVTLGDLAYVAGLDPSQASTAWVATYVLIALAALHPSLPQLFGPAPRRPGGPTELWTIAPALIALAAAVVLAAGGWSITAPSAFFAVVTTGAILLRLTALLTDNRSVTDELASAATRDPLTGLRNRRHLYAHLTDRARATEDDLVLFFVDLDRFKEVNDRYGHHTGDRVLTETSRRLERAVRGSDLVWRLAGDEFIVLCHCPGGQAAQVADRLLTAIEQPLEIDGEPIRVGASIGFVPFDPDEAIDEQIVAADRAMYHSKQSSTD